MNIRVYDIKHESTLIDLDSERKPRSSSRVMRIVLPDNRSFIRKTVIRLIRPTVIAFSGSFVPVLFN